ncbi:MAG: hypothetical protein CSA65_08025 [Proteobacteria bacterium]|nr:MAG: hypothetical protein CSA65_08025 [Pseudomonadota bacterium]
MFMIDLAVFLAARSKGRPLASAGQLVVPFAGAIPNTTNKGMAGDVTNNLSTRLGPEWVGALLRPI